ncbi:hypothetical protein CHUAL_008067 [Chamberlinius hualienensis]
MASEKKELSSRGNDSEDAEENKETNEDDNNMLCEHNVKSTAVVKYAAFTSPARFYKLQNNTNLNETPENWLRGVWNAYSKHMAFSSFNMATNFLDCVGEVDVVSDAENIKKLLKIPYSNSPVSLMVHRIGKTLLLDNFDVHCNLLHTAKKEWEWLRKFYFEQVLCNLGQKGDKSFQKTRSRQHLQNKNMESKFLYYSIANACETRRGSDSGSPSRRKTWNPPMASSKTRTSADSEPIVDDEKAFDDISFQRNIVWNFEDIRMLIGTDMPIFGGGTHPCVSLRLRDINKPINILTGIDYWLDNLMCNVPEVMMCYHLEGIVQKYERIKTEDIPQLGDSTFSPNVIKFIAQNILSFLKSNATKTGHTYWLIKTKDDEAVKLYDLTTLCAENADDKEQNPFTVHVAMLLYRVAHNMTTQGPTQKQKKTVCTLLENCIALLDFRKHSKIITTARYLLSDLYIPSTIDLSSPLLDTENNDKLNAEIYYEEEVSYLEESGTEALATCSVDVKALCLPDSTIRHDHVTAVGSAIPGILENCCQTALKHTEKGLNCIQISCQNISHVREKTKLNSSEDVQQQASPLQPIPLPFKTLSNDNISQNMPEAIENMHLQCTDSPCFLSGTWQCNYTGLLLQKACISSYAMANHLYNVKEYGTALKYLEMAFLIYNSMEEFAKMKREENREIKVLPCYLLSLAGDLHFLIVQNHNQYSTYSQQYDQFNSWNGIKSFALNILKQSEFFHWAVKKHSKIEDSLITSHKCYKIALSQEGNPETKLKIQKRLGNIKNELGVYYMSQAANLYESSDKSAEPLLKMSSDYLKKGAKIFEAIDDVANIGLLYSNLARLHRVTAEYYNNLYSNTGCKEFTKTARGHYDKAVDYYNMALRSLGDSDEHVKIRETITYDLCTTYFTMGVNLQDYPPISDGSLEEIEKDITELMCKSLKLCNCDSSNNFQIHYQIRVATIYKRLGSLYHHNYRTSADEKKKRQKKALAENNLSKAVEKFKELDDSNEYLETQLERIGLWETHFSGVSGNNAKEKCLKILLDILLDSIPVLTAICDNDASDSNSDEQEEKDRATKYLKLLQGQTNWVLLNLVKLYSLMTETQKMEHYKKIYLEAIQSVSGNDSIPFCPNNLLLTLSKMKAFSDIVN